MSNGPEYHITTDLRFEPLTLIDIPELVRSCEHEWFNETVSAVNGCVVRLGIIRGDFHWHKYDEEDEFFYVVEGRLHIDLEERTVELGPKQGFTVPRTILHRTRAPEGAVILMFEGAGVVPTGD